ncbi:MAG: glycoside hydrolase family 88 protein, partial [Muribaculaceae bacterium]|nr:glycoside hydrolase family 88 protein [Muribaculaceae bacterium]
FPPVVRNVTIENITSNKSKYGVMIIALDNSVNVYDINVIDCKFNNVADGNSITGLTRDINFKNYYINGSLCLREKPYKHYSEWMATSEMKRQPESYLLDFSTRPKWSYVMGIELESMLDTYLKHGNKEIFEYCKLYTDTMINSDGKIRGYNIEDYNLDNIRTGHFVTRMYEVLPEEKNLKAMKTLMKQMEDQPRTKEGVYWHKAIYSYQVWLDGIFMGLPYSALTTKILNDPQKSVKIWDDAVDQVKKTYERTLDPKTGLNRHAWDENRDMFWSDKETGLSQHSWARAQGWYTMALIELLDAMPEDYPRRNEVIELLEKDLDAVINWQDKDSGVWYQVMDSPEREGNYLESTASSMFAYSLLKAFRKGYLGEKYRDAGLKAYRGILNNFIRVNPDSTISLTECCAVAGLGPGLSPSVLAAAPNVKENRRRDGSFEYYLSEPVRDNDAKGVGPFIWASLEMEEMGYDTESSHNAINRKGVVNRNNPEIRKAGPLAALSIGNGHLVATVDVTGLQSYPEFYKNGIPLTTMSDWGWQSFPNPENLKHEETLATMNLHNRQSLYAVEYKEEGTRNKKATEYFRANPHRLNLATVGLELMDAEGKRIPIEELTDINQKLSLWDGKIESDFSADGETVSVITAVEKKKDILFSRIKTDLLSEGRAKINFRFSYPSGKHSDDANVWDLPEKHSTTILQAEKNSALVKREIEGTTYYVLIQWEGNVVLEDSDVHSITLSTPDNVLAFCAEFSEDVPQKGETSFSFDQSIKGVMRDWPNFWRSGGIVDFSECKDPRAKELERRVVLSQYLTEINCNNSFPPQETGLTYNSWFGRPHLEMIWWHAVDFALWNRPQMVENMLAWYNSKAYPEAKKIAQRQGFKGVRWMKMTDPDAGEAPSNTGSFLTWQQPHYIYLAEEMYRYFPNSETLEKYASGVEETAEFMADFAKACAPEKGLIYLYGQTAMQESMSKDFSFGHPFEQAYWWYGLSTAQQWRERRGLERVKEWDEIIGRLAPLTEVDGIYTAGKPLAEFSGKAISGEFDPYATPDIKGKKQISKEDFDLKSRSDHPAVLGACGLLPKSPLYKTDVMEKTLDWVMENWNWDTTWGWDYGMIAMAAARLGRPEIAIDALMIEKGKNTYLVNGHNFQEPNRLRLYMPGNGALLDAIAMMCAGWDGCTLGPNPGFPKDGNWNVRWEDLHRMQ